MAQEVIVPWEGEIARRQRWNSDALRFRNPHIPSSIACANSYITCGGGHIGLVDPRCLTGDKSPNGNGSGSALRKRIVVPVSRIAPGLPLLPLDAESRLELACSLAPAAMTMDNLIEAAQVVRLFLEIWQTVVVSQFPDGANQGQKRRLARAVLPTSSVSGASRAVCSSRKQRKFLSVTLSITLPPSPNRAARPWRRCGRARR